MAFESAKNNTTLEQPAMVENLNQMRQYALSVQATQPELSELVKRVEKELTDFLQEMEKIARSAHDHITSDEDKEQSSEQRELIAALREFVEACGNIEATDSLQTLLHDDEGLHARVNAWAARQIRTEVGKL